MNSGGYERPGAQGTRGSSEATIMQLIDELEAQIVNGRRVSIMNVVGVDRQHVLAIIDRLRVSIPTELEQARRVVQERQQIILEAQEEAERIVETARKRAEYMVGDVGLMAEARQRGEERLRYAEENSQRTRVGAEQYALSVIDELEGLIRSNLREIERAKQAIRETHETGRSPGES